jgi:hypothetical protein
MTQGKSSGSSLAIFVFLTFSFSYGTQMNKRFTESRHDRPLSAFFFASAGSIEHLLPCELWWLLACNCCGSLNFFEETANMTFDHARTVIKF